MPSTITAGTTSGTSLNFSGDTSGVLTVQGVTMGNGGVGDGNATRFKNRIINGDMSIDQRNAGASVTPANATYTLDRWQSAASASSKYSIQQNAGSVTPPAGFSNYLGVTSLSAYSVGASEVFAIFQPIEGFNTADLDFGKSTAKTITLSFWVRSSLTGTFGGSLNNSGYSRSYPFSYTISSANTWEQKSVTVVGDTTGTWVGSTNGMGLGVQFSLGTGSSLSGTAGTWSGSTLLSATGAVSVVGTNGATFYVTGVQLEVGSTASAFEVVDYTTELQLCQRYYYRQSGASAYGRFGTGFSNSTTNLFATVNFPVAMRAKPTSIVWTGNLGVWAGGTIFSVSAVSLESGSEMTTSAVAAATTSGISGTTAYALIGNNSSTASLAFNAEL
jgi:hypothetical protein